MSASITAAPARTSFGRFSLAIALMALAVVIAAAVALVALNGTKTAAPTTGTAAQYGQSVTNVPFYDHGWSSASTAPARASRTCRSTTTAGASPARPRPPRYFGPYYYNGYDSYAPFDATKGASTGTGYPPFGATYAPSTSVGYPLSGASYFGASTNSVGLGYPPFGTSNAGEPQYVAPRPRNQ